MDGKPIVVAYDGSEQSDMALRWALDEGVRRASPVAIAHVLAPDMHQPGLRGRTSRLDKEAKSAVDRIANESYDWGRLGIEVTGAVLDGPVAQVLCEQSQTASMVVMGARGLGGFAGLWPCLRGGRPPRCWRSWPCVDGRRHACRGTPRSSGLRR
jgi:nucleotide-binding universal stress UspA family protein